MGEIGEKLRKETRLTFLSMLSTNFFLLFLDRLSEPGSFFTVHQSAVAQWLKGLEARKALLLQFGQCHYEDATNRLPARCRLLKSVRLCLCQAGWWSPAPTSLSAARPTARATEHRASEFTAATATTAMWTTLPPVSCRDPAPCCCCCCCWRPPHSTVFSNRCYVTTRRSPHSPLTMMLIPPWRLRTSSLDVCLTQSGKRVPVSMDFTERCLTYLWC